MTLRGLLLPLFLGPAFVTGCIATKDMGEDDTETGSESGTTDAMTGDDAPTTNPTTNQMTGDDAGTTAQVTDDAGTTAEDDAGSDDAGTTLATTDDGGSGSSTSGSDDQADCEATGGTWDPTACGHYGCGLPQECAAVIPGCDCGPTMNFVDGTGCVEDPACLQATFECGELDCTVATEYCEVLHPGVPGPSSFSCNALPAACVADSTCTCLDEEGVSGGAGQCTELKGGGLQVDVFAP
jgi:hypothetical protein